MQLWPFLSLLIHFDFIMLTETWSNDSENIDIPGPGFHYFASGGIAFYYAKEHSRGVSLTT